MAHQVASLVTSLVFVRLPSTAGKLPYPTISSPTVTVSILLLAEVALLHKAARSDMAAEPTNWLVEVLFGCC